MPASSSAAAPPPVLLHVGTPKSGTTYLQRQLHANRSRLRAAGFLYPGDRPSHFLQAMDLRGRGFHGHGYEGMEGAWQRLCDEVLDFDGPALISHEMIGGMAEPARRRAATSFPGRDVRVVVTCRDLGRQLPALWQEKVKNGAKLPFGRYLARAEKSWQGTGSADAPWGSQNLVGLGHRWAEVVGEDHVTFVTVPPGGSPPGELWRRFAEAVGLTDVDVELVDSGSNTSMGTAEVELLRRINSRLPADLAWPEHSQLVKKRFAQQRLAGSRFAGALTVPPARRPTFEGIAETILEELGRSAFPVVGDLADLRPVFGDGTTPRSLTESTVTDVAVDQLVALLLRDRGRAGRRRRAGRNRGAASDATSPPRAAARRLVRRLRRDSGG